LCDKVIDRNEVAEKVVFCALADLCAQRRLVLTVRPVEHVLGQRWLCRLVQRCGYKRYDLLVRRDGSFAASPLNQALNELFDSLLVPGSDFITEQRLPVRRLLQLLFKTREEERNPYHEVVRWVGDELIDEGYYIESTDMVAGVTPFTECHPDLDKMRAAADRVAALRERLDRFARQEPERYTALRDTVKQTMKELAVLHSRRYTL
jgi:hypothetical protein